MAETFTTMHGRLQRKLLALISNRDVEDPFVWRVDRALAALLAAQRYW